MYEKVWYSKVIVGFFRISGIFIEGFLIILEFFGIQILAGKAQFI